AHANRYHTGLRGNEQAAILQHGETVMTRELARRNKSALTGLSALAASGGAAPGVKIEIVNNGEPVNARDNGTKFDGKEVVVSLILDTIASGKADPAMRRFGAKPRLKVRG